MYFILSSVFYVIVAVCQLLIKDFLILLCFAQFNVYICEVLEETSRSLEGRLVSEESEKLAAYERETQLVAKVTITNHTINIAR